jgi:arylsulfatase A-like enzyme
VAGQNANAPLGSINSPETRRRFYASYFQQVRCVRKALQEFFEGVQQIGAYDDATIIVHGDHGSRITLTVSNRMYADLLTDDDLVDDYSTLFAVYGPGFDRGYDTSFRSIQALFAELFLQRTLTQEPTDVVLSASLHIGDWDDNEPWMRAPMPFFGASSAAPRECDSVSDCKPLVEPTAQ